MKLDLLRPPPTDKRPFRLSHQKFVPARRGCYVLSTVDDVVLYVGLAVDLRRRMGQHLDDREKTEVTPMGRAVWFHWLEHAELNKLERTWQNIHLTHEGRLPVLNKVYSPTHT